MKRLVYILCTVLATSLFVSCQRTSLSLQGDPLAFSEDTVLFDTVFTTFGSTTHLLKVYNPTKQPIYIDNVHLREGRFFHINFDGITSPEQVNHYRIDSNDSLYVFIKVLIDPQDSNSPVIIEDDLLITTETNTQAVNLRAYGQDIEIVRSLQIHSDTTLSLQKPYLVSNYIYVDSLSTLTLAAGVTLLMSDSAQLIVRGQLRSLGTQDKPVVMRGARLYRIFTKVPYDYVPGQWGGVFLINYANEMPKHHVLDHTNIRDANTGLFCQSANISSLPSIRIANSKINNHSLYGLVLINTSSHITNTEISNCNNYCVYLAGGQHVLTHNTIASYYKHTNVRVFPQDDTQLPSAPVAINDLSKSQQRTIVYFTNNVIAGCSSTNLILATPLLDAYHGKFQNNYILGDTIVGTPFQDNVFGQITDTIFKNDFYSSQDYRYFDFRLDSMSVARGIALKDSALAYPTDKIGIERNQDGAPDAGCYEYN